MSNFKTIHAYQLFLLIILVLVYPKLIQWDLNQDFLLANLLYFLFHHHILNILLLNLLYVMMHYLT